MSVKWALSDLRVTSLDDRSAVSRRSLNTQYFALDKKGGLKGNWKMWPNVAFCAASVDVRKELLSFQKIIENTMWEDHSFKHP